MALDGEGDDFMAITSDDESPSGPSRIVSSQGRARIYHSPKSSSSSPTQPALPQSPASPTAPSFHSAIDNPSSPPPRRQSQQHNFGSPIAARQLAGSSASGVGAAAPSTPGGAGPGARTSGNPTSPTAGTRTSTTFQRPAMSDPAFRAALGGGSNSPHVHTTGSISSPRRASVQAPGLPPASFFLNRKPVNPIPAPSPSPIPGPGSGSRTPTTTMTPATSGTTSYPPPQLGPLSTSSDSRPSSYGRKSSDGINISPRASAHYLDMSDVGLASDTSSLGKRGSLAERAAMARALGHTRKGSGSGSGSGIAASAVAAAPGSGSGSGSGPASASGSGTLSRGNSLSRGTPTPAPLAGFTAASDLSDDEANSPGGTRTGGGSMSGRVSALDDASIGTHGTQGPESSLAHERVGPGIAGGGGGTGGMATKASREPLLDLLAAGRMEEDDRERAELKARSASGGSGNGSDRSRDTERDRSRPRKSLEKVARAARSSLVAGFGVGGAGGTSKEGDIMMSEKGRSRDERPFSNLDQDGTVRAGLAKEGYGNGNGFGPGKRKNKSKAGWQNLAEVPLTNEKGRKVRNWELHEGGNRFWFDGILMSSGDSPFPFIISSILAALLPIAFVVFSADYLWTHLSPAVPILFAYPLTLVMWASMAVTAFRDPGIVPRGLDVDAEDLARQERAEDRDRLGMGMGMDGGGGGGGGGGAHPMPPTLWAKFRDGEVPIKYCETCRSYRPPRTSHCRLCNGCIQMTDHHCTFLNNCIGRRNYGSFLAFLISAVLTSLYCISFSVYHLITYSNSSTPTDPSPSIFSSWRTIGTLVVAILSLVASIPIGGLLSYHIMLVWTNRTTIEMVRARSKVEGANVNKYTYESHWSNLVGILCRPMRVPSAIERRGVATRDLRQDWEDDVGRLA